MSKQRYILSILAAGALAAGAAGGESAVETHVREGDAAGALALLATPEGREELPPAEADYWKGRALTMLGRLEEAAECFNRVPWEHRLHPYAARGLIYCAWKCPELPFDQWATTLATSPDAEVAELALAALAEYQLRYTNTDDMLAYKRLHEKARQNSELEPVVRLLSLHQYRRQGDGGIEYAKRLEQDSSLTPIMRQRVRLALAELYYAKEKAEPPHGESNDEGKGEETLLQFITANPETPLLDEAFRRLCMHTGTTGSDYVRAKLRDWAEDTAHPKRAALALYTLHQMEPVHGSDPATLANRAATELPGEPMTITILQEHIRKLLMQGKQEEAQRYLNLLGTLQKEPDARSLFLLAMNGQEPPAEGTHEAATLPAVQLFHRSAERADSELLGPALVNTLICAVRSGKPELAEELLAGEHGKHNKCALLLAHAGLLLQKDPERARRELDEALQLNPTPEQRTDIELDMAQLKLANAPAETLQELLQRDAAARRAWTEPQQLRYAALVENAADLAHGDACGLLRRLYEQSETLPLKEGLALHLADRLAASQRHAEALELLLELAQALPAGASKAAALFYAGHESALLGTLAALEEAVALYEQSVRQGSGLSTRAMIEQAAILVRINRTREALALLHPLEEPEKFKTLSPEDQARLLTTLADAYGLDMTPQSLASAAAYCERISELPGIAPAWRVRGYLQYAALCTRMGKREEALAAYRRVLHIERNRADASEPQSCQLLYYAASGAVYQLLQMERYEEAAALADAVAAWPGSDTPGPKADAFRRWAQSIRQTHFLSIPVLEPSAAEL